MFGMIHMMKYLSFFLREELKHDEFIFEREVEISDDNSECNEYIFTYDATVCI